ncbi:MAG TPA: polysaccharide export protein [Aquificae bacterium]|nr:polysaccharide export protein [Aquificota bacterium]
MKIYFKDFLKIYFYFFILNINIALAQNVIKQTTDIIKVSNALNPITKRLQLFKKQSYQDKLNNSQDLENLKNFTENKFLKISIENINRPSPLEKKYNQIIKIYKEIIKNQNFITQFGYDIFDKIPKPFISIVDYSKYIIGPKDKLTIYIWNVPEEIYPQKIDLYVNENGKVYLPKIGTLYVAGKSIKDLKKLIKRKLRRYIKNPKIDIFVEIPRQISVILAGEIGKVGTYNLCSLNTLWDALNIAGGIKKSGSLREILLIRSFGKKKKVYIFDLYCLLGVKTFKCLKKLNPKTFYLKDGDIIYVPSIQNTFAIVGEVKKNYIFEYKSRLSLKEAIGKYASYFTPFANLKNIGIIRQYNDGSYGIYKNLSYKDIKKSKIYIKNGDIIVINSNKILDNNTIVVKGPVLNEGYFSLKENPYLSDLLKKIRFTPNTNMEFAVIKNNMKNKIISFSPRQVINNLFDFPKVSSPCFSLFYIGCIIS